MSIGPNSSEQKPSPYEHTRLFAVDPSVAPGRRDDLNMTSVGNVAIDGIAKAYNQAGNDYIAYADGNPRQLFSFSGLHAYADRHVWSILEAKLHDLKAAGASSITLLDAGCGPGTWLRRLVTRALMLGFRRITARGFDVASAQIDIARLLARDLISTPGVDLSFDVSDLESRMPERDASVDVTLCLYSVLSHLRVTSLRGVARELGRVTRGHFVSTVRSIGSTPTVFIDSLEKVAAECNISASTVALAWLQARPGVTSTIIGASTLAQLEANLKALDVRLTPDQIQRLDDASKPVLNFPAEFLKQSPSFSHAGTTVNGVPSQKTFLVPGDDSVRW